MRAPHDYALRVDGLEITGTLCRSIYTGEQFVDARACKCKPDTAYSVSEGGRYSLWERGTSCVHSVASLIRALLRHGASLGQILALALDPEHKGFAWLQHREHDPHEPAAWWNASPATVATSMVLYAAHSAHKATRRVAAKPGWFNRAAQHTDADGFVYHLSMWSKFLQVVSRYPSASRRGLERALAYVFPKQFWNRGVRAKYLTEAIRKGFVRPVATGFRNAINYVVEQWPPAPVRSVSHLVDPNTGEILSTRVHKRLTTSQALYAIQRGHDVITAQADLDHWRQVYEDEHQESSARKFRALKKRVAEKVAS